MSKTAYSLEDFVLDPEFRKWVLSHNASNKSYWEEYIQKNPAKLKDITLARRILLNMSRNTAEVSGTRLDAMWQNIDQAVQEIDVESIQRKTVPISSQSTILRYEIGYPSYSKSAQLYRMAGILILVFTLGILANLIFPQPSLQTVEAHMIYEEHIAPPGVKSNLTLQDGSRVILNSGSSLRYIKNFEVNQRVLELMGEAYFEVAKDSMRPFTVKTGQITTTALGTSFNISAYDNEEMDISLLTGLVEVRIAMGDFKKVNLVPGEELNINLAKEQYQKRPFVKEKLMAWTRKTILFDHAPIAEITRVLENWYGVEIRFTNQPNKNLVVSGSFRDQSLENVLVGLSYSARFKFDIQQDIVYITFK
ncbi:FecR family protein [Algoriphagus persicinus]|uniref:FecR family protein n=1 Tax=Algoriphagus persicinus TaxID=3108754 RepID=UPI002B3824E9|nr:FecR domain-containing protein [Algoriphagus sp. E1-3-M2]MEB2786616.1 FecR domain-containing protein [Algoriphagus sp. E1-3-M2]